MPLEGDLEKTAEIIFLVRPDFVIFDEVRRARDFEILLMLDWQVLGCLVLRMPILH